MTDHVHELIGELREPRLGIHNDGTEELKDWGTLFDQCDKAADCIEAILNEHAKLKRVRGRAQHKNGCWCTCDLLDALADTEE